MTVYLDYSGTYGTTGDPYDGIWTFQCERGAGILSWAMDKPRKVVTYAFKEQLGGARPCGYEPLPKVPRRLPNAPRRPVKVHYSSQGRAPRRHQGKRARTRWYQRP
ncbi:hypothetical protein [Planobispora rosea]|uniref:hypothetical protein n=1 Tax=Planobispora rosea TaxID=35762 RepID=UPI00114CD09A|nr:hypothetical protein [Planobispora rosea]